MEIIVQQLGLSPYLDQFRSVLPCSDRDTILVLHSLTAEKVGLNGSELLRSRSVVRSVTHKSFCTLERNVNFSLNGNLKLKYETKNYNIK